MEVLAFQIFHGDEFHALGFTEVVNPDHVAVGYLGRGAEALFLNGQDFGIRSHLGRMTFRNDSIYSRSAALYTVPSHLTEEFENFISGCPKEFRLQQNRVALGGGARATRSSRDDGGAAGNDCGPHRPCAAEWPSTVASGFVSELRQKQSGRRCSLLRTRGTGSLIAAVRRQRAFRRDSKKELLPHREALLLREHVFFRRPRERHP